MISGKAYHDDISIISNDIFGRTYCQDVLPRHCSQHPSSTSLVPLNLYYIICIFHLSIRMIKIVAASSLYHSIKQDASDYRPISLLSAVSKLLGTLIFSKLIPVVYPTLNPAQHGFRPKRSTTTNLIEYLHEIFSCLDSNPSYLTTFYIDFQKAFDKVSHDLLLDKLSALDIGGNCLSLLRSYLSNRKQTVRINTTSKELCL